MNIKNPVWDEIQRAHKADVIQSYRMLGRIITIRFNKKTKKDTILKVRSHLDVKYKTYIQTVECVGTHSLRIILYEK